MTRIHKIVLLAVLALLALPAQGMAASKFGAKLTPDVQPSNASAPHACQPDEDMPTGPCTRVLMDAYGRPDQPNAPKSGTIKRIRLIAGAPGSFQLQLVKANAATQRAKLVRNGPTINYQGQDSPDAETYKVESFKVKVPVKKGQYLAIRSSETSTLRCSSGGPNQLIFQPPLSLGSPFRTATDTDGCWLLLEAVIK
jgi:hypothetical protein